MPVSVCMIKVSCLNVCMLRYYAYIELIDYTGLNHIMFAPNDVALRN